MRAAGNLGVVELPPIERWTKNGGKEIVRRFSGPYNLLGPDSMSGTKAFQLKQAGVDYEISTTPGQFPIISATYGADGATPSDPPQSDIWDIDTNDLEKDIWEHPTIVAEIKKTHVSSIKTYAAAQALKDIKAMIKGERVEQDGRVITLDEAIGVAVTVGMSSTVLLAFVRECINGTTNFYVDQYVLRRVRVVSENTALKVGSSEGGVGTVFNTAAITSTTFEKAPSSIPGFGPLPPGEWLKRRPKTNPSGQAGKWEIVNEYWHADSWSSLLYPTRKLL